AMVVGQRRHLHRRCAGRDVAEQLAQVHGARWTTSGCTSATNGAISEIAVGKLGRRIRPG
ncbi:MAG: hypothetical protein ACRDMZ_23175, partial [Solirubrobacteraceae bacterium]